MFKRESEQNNCILFNEIQSQIANSSIDIEDIGDLLRSWGSYWISSQQSDNEINQQIIIDKQSSENNWNHTWLIPIIETGFQKLSWTINMLLSAQNKLNDIFSFKVF